MKNDPLSVPTPGTRDPRAQAQVLAAVAARWRAGTSGLPAPLVDWVFAALEARLRQPGERDEAGAQADAAAALPQNWPRPDALGPALAMLDALALDALLALFEAGLLERTALEAQNAVFGHARAAVATHAAAPAGDAALSLEQALAARDRQLSIATHELRTPISSILLNLQMLERAAQTRGSLDRDTIARLLRVPSRQLRRLTRMVDLLLDAAQVENERLVLHRQQLDLCAVVHEAVARLRTLAEEAGCTVDLQHCEPVYGWWDRLRLEQVVTNLVTNGIKYGGCRVEVRTLAAPEPRIVVRDWGNGIADEDQGRIFEPFERVARTAGEDGAGLGLYIVREIVRAHGGRIEVESRPGEGATFTVVLPIEDKE